LYALLILLAVRRCGYLAIFAEVTGAGAVENQRVVHHIELEHIAHHVLNILNARVAELHHLVAVGANQVVVLVVTIRFLVLRQVAAELVFRY